MFVSEPSGYQSLTASNKKNKLALVVGVNNSTILNTRQLLQYAERDAAEMAWVLEEAACGFTLIEPALRGPDAKTWEIQQALMRLVGERTERDFLLFYFSGHAQPIETPGGHRDIYLVTYNFKESDVMLSPAIHLSLRWLREMLFQKTNAGAVLVILDCCYAGNIIRADADPYYIDLGRLIENWLEESDGVSKDSPRMMLTATGYNNSAQEKDGHGRMTYWMLRALRGIDDEVLDDHGQVDISLLHKYLKKNIPEQFPNLAGEFGQYHWILANYPDRAVQLRRNAQKAEESELRTQVIQLANKVSEVRSIITDPDYFKKLSEDNTHFNVQQFDQITDKTASITDLDQAKVTEFFKRNRVQIQDDFDREASDQEHLQNFGFLQASYPTYGALLCFGLTPTTLLAGAFTRCTLWSGNDRNSGWLDAQDYRRDLITQFESSRDFLRKNLRLPRVIGMDERIEEPEIPMVALGEALANALVHREYVHQTSPVYVDIFHNRVEIISPGIPPEPLTLEILEAEHTSHPRNPQIARIFYLYDYVEKVGSGIQRMQRAMEKAELPPTKLELGKDKSFKVIFYRPKQVLKEPVDVFISYSKADEATAERLKADLRDQGIIAWTNVEAIDLGTVNWEETMRLAIRTAHAVLLLASPNARSSRYVRDELTLATFYDRPIYPLWIEGITWIDSIPLGWGLSQYIDAREIGYKMAVSQLVQALNVQVSASSHVPLLTSPSEIDVEPRNPYKGLNAFTAADARDFFGRTTLINELIEALKEALLLGKDSKQREALLTIVGPSGSGKSSLVLAGLLPTLQQGALLESKDWLYLDPIVPGSHPTEALTLTLAEVLPERSLTAIRQDLEDDSARGLYLYASSLTQSYKKPETKVVLVIDQFEEIFTQTSSESERQHFIDLLVNALIEHNSPLIIILNLRADFYARPMHYPELMRLIQGHQRLVSPMGVMELRAVIEQPAALPDVQLTFEENLIGDLLFDVQGQVGILPLLQFTLDQMFYHRNGHILTRQAYNDIGGVKGALTKHAESSYLALPSEERRQLARTIFTRLIDLGTTEQDITRRRTRLSEFTFDDAKRTRVLHDTIDAFVTARLLSVNQIAGIATIEVSHEALIREWARLSQWLHEAREDIFFQQKISQDVDSWERRGKSKDRLYRGSQLKEARMWAKRNMTNSPQAAFIRASNAYRRRYIINILALVLISMLTMGSTIELLITTRPVWCPTVLCPAPHFTFAAQDVHDANLDLYYIGEKDPSYRLPNGSTNYTLKNLPKGVSAQRIDDGTSSPNHFVLGIHSLQQGHWGIGIEQVALVVQKVTPVSQPLRVWTPSSSVFYNTNLYQIKYTGENKGVTLPATFVNFPLGYVQLLPAESDQIELEISSRKVIDLRFQVQITYRIINSSQRKILTLPTIFEIIFSDSSNWYPYRWQGGSLVPGS